ncbi:DUF1129 family protein [Paenibacillus sp. DMB20]|uniref:DUF1129 family protein n=1 Tax=Paenibacillus sp. DMB20 TaxID=1642570 RepID=UPI0006281BFC|nr:DUF1129 family protein [Paenibacillus sp. DMB20]KKO55080.1 hypothetical protein XI25_02740 [Paenibacillus sp. DMB20]
MTIKQMIRENNRLQEQMTPANLKYYEDMVIYIRTSSVNEAKGEELLLEMAQHLLEAQRTGKTAEEVFGSDPIAYCAELVDELPKLKGLSRLQFNLMIPWVALTWFFFAQAIVGFVALWTGGSVEKMSQVRISTLLLIAAGSYVLIRAIMGLMKLESFQPEDAKRKISLRGLGIYVLVVVAILVGGVWLGRALPVLVVPPWGSLVIFIIGLVGTKVFFSRR